MQILKFFLLAAVIALQFATPLYAEVGRNLIPFGSGKSILRLGK